MQSTRPSNGPAGSNKRRNTDLEARENSHLRGGEVCRGLALEPLDELEVVPHEPARVARLYSMLQGYEKLFPRDAGYEPRDR